MKESVMTKKEKEEAIRKQVAKKRFEELHPLEIDVDKKKHKFSFSEVKTSMVKADPVMPYLAQLEDQLENEICKLMEEINRNYHIMSRLHVLDEMIQPNAINSNQPIANCHMEVIQNKIGQLGQLVNSLREINNEMDKVL